MMNVKGVTTAIVVGLALLGCTGAVWSLGLGSPTSHAILGETLSVTVPLRLEAGEEITPECVAADVFFGDDKLSGSAVSAALLPGDGTQRTVRVTTTSLINEPVVTVYLAAGCKARITRKLVAFADPPSLPTLAERTATETAVAARAQGRAQDGAGTARTSEAPVNPSAAPAATVAEAGRPAAARAARSGPARASNGDRAGQAPRRSTTAAITRETAPGLTRQATSSAAPTAPADKAAARDPAASRLSAKVDPRPEPSGGARLELDPADLDAVVAPALLMSSGLTGLSDNPDAPQVRERRAAAAALWAAMNASPEQLARDRQRMQELEQRLARLQQDSAGAQARVAAMEARLKEAEDPLAARWLTYALLAACLVLVAALAWLWRRQKAEAQASTWWESGQQTEAPLSEAAADVEPALARTSAEFMPVRRDAAEPGPAVSAPSTPAAVPAAAATTQAVPAPSSAPARPAVQVSVQAAGVTEPAATQDTRAVLLKSEVQDAVRAITVEELIDLEQQAEFFVVLGQDDAAIELLESHVQTTAGASPLPYLKLLEIHQRLGRREDYERVRLAFNGRFNAYAPDWDADLQHGHSLEDYPGVVERLQSLWSTPARAMEVLQVSLTRADGSEETFDLPAYRELLFLYAVARDLSERESQDRAPVDLLLPVHDRQSSEDGPVEEVPQPLMATRPVKASPEATPSLSLDLSLDDPAPASFQVAGAALENTSSQAAGPQDDGHLIDFEPIDIPQRPKG